MRKTVKSEVRRYVSSRRAFMVSAAGAVTLLPATSPAAVAVAGEPAIPQSGTGESASPASTPPAGYTQLGPEEARFLELVVDVMCPADALTPSGTDCGLATFIDRQLNGDFGKGGRLYS